MLIANHRASLIVIALLSIALMAIVFVSQATCPTTKTAYVDNNGEHHASWTMPAGCSGTWKVYLTVGTPGTYTVWIQNDSHPGTYALSPYDFSASQGCTGNPPTVTLAAGDQYTMVVTFPLGDPSASAKIFLDCGQG